MGDTKQNGTTPKGNRIETRIVDRDGQTGVHVFVVGPGGAEYRVQKSSTQSTGDVVKALKSGTTKDPLAR